MLYDIFISHASEDKEDIVMPLAGLLREYGLKVWVDAIVLKVGDSLRRKIEKGLVESRFGVVILSPNFFKKEWPQKELDALVSREYGSEKVILPVFHNVCHDDVRIHSPLLADKLAVSTQKGIDFVAHQIIDVVLGRSTTDKQFNRRILIGISGASCSGKTWLAKKFYQMRPNSVCLFDLDSYYKEHEFVSSLEYKHDNPSAINFEDALIDLCLLKSGKEVKIPEYDYELHRRISKRLCKPKPIIVVDGLFVFANKRLRNELDIKIWVDSGEDLRYERRVRRDTVERGRDVNEVIDRYAEDVKPGYQKHIQPLREEADIILENNGRDRNQQPMIVDMLLAYIDKLRYQIC